jgi:hypothetical protein
MRVSIMAEDTKRLADRIWELGNALSKVFNTTRVIYYFDHDRQDKIHLKYKTSDTSHTSEVSINIDTLNLTLQERDWITYIKVTDVLRQKQNDEFSTEFLPNFEQKLKQRITHIENKDEAITLLENYRAKRNIKSPPSFQIFSRKHNYNPS